MKIEAVTTHPQDVPEIKKLMNRAFPRKERLPLRLLLGSEGNHQECVAFYEGDEFCGFAILLSWQDITHILYIAMEESVRNRGLGSEALTLIHQRYPNQRIIADLEREDDNAPNAIQRRIRRSFYERNGYVATPVEYVWHNEFYRIFCRGGSLTRQEFDDFWDHFEDER